MSITYVIFGSRWSDSQTHKLCNCVTIMVFWTVKTCTLLNVYRCFRAICCLCHQEIKKKVKVASSTKTSILMYQNIRHHISENCIFPAHCHECWKTCTYLKTLLFLPQSCLLSGLQSTHNSLSLLLQSLVKHWALIQLTGLYRDSCICVTGMRNVDDLVSMCAACRERVNPYLFNYALSVALLHRPDTRNLRIPALFESFPDKFVDGAIFNKARQETEIFLSGSRVCSYKLQRI